MSYRHIIAATLPRSVERMYGDDFIIHHDTVTRLSLTDIVLYEFDVTTPAGVKEHHIWRREGCGSGTVFRRAK